VDLTGLLRELKQLTGSSRVDTARLVPLTRTHQSQQI
jgi:hypothetical protein